MAIFFINDSELTDSDSAVYLDGLSACTWSSWVKFNSDFGSTDRGWLKGNAPDDDDIFVSMRFDVSGTHSLVDRCLKLGLSLTSGQHNKETAEDTQTLEWMHVLAVWSSGSVMRVFLNGVQDTWDPGITGDGTGTFTGTHQPLTVGKGAKDVASPSGWNGWVDDLRIYNRALSDNEIKTLYALRGNDRIFEGLLVRYCFREGAPGVGVGTTTDLIKDWGNDGKRNLTRTGTAEPTFSASLLRTGGRRRS